MKDVMTFYEYAGEMQELCFKISQAHKAMGDTGLYDFYFATSRGYEKARDNFSVREAEAYVNEEQMKMLENSRAYVKEVQKQAAEKLDQEVTA